MTAGEFAALDDKSRAAVTYEVLASIQTGQKETHEALEELKKCFQNDRVEGEGTIAAVAKAQSTADVAMATGKAANRRLDSVVWAVAGFSVTTLVSLAIAILTYFLERKI